MDKTKDNNSIDSLVLKLTGKAEIPSRLEIGHNYTVSVKGSITSVTEADKFDGSHILYYKFEPVFIDLITDMGETIKAKDTRSNSKKIRNSIWHLWEHDPDSSKYIFEEYYDMVCRQILFELDEIIERAKRR